MKLLTCLIIGLIMIACGDDDCCVLPESNSEFIGAWKHTESCFSPGGPTIQCNDYSEVEIFRFSEKGVFELENGQGRFTGEYSINYTQPNNTPDFLNLQIDGTIEDPVRVYKVRKLDGDILELTLHQDDGMSLCIEACYEGFVRE